MAELLMEAFPGALVLNLGEWQPDLRALEPVVLDLGALYPVQADPVASDMVAVALEYLLPAVLGYVLIFSFWSHCTCHWLVLNVELILISDRTLVLYQVAIQDSTRLSPIYSIECEVTKKWK